MTTIVSPFENFEKNYTWPPTNANPIPPPAQAGLDCIFALVIVVPTGEFGGTITFKSAEVTVVLERTSLSKIKFTTYSPPLYHAIPKDDPACLNIYVATKPVLVNELKKNKNQCNELKIT